MNTSDHSPMNEQHSEDLHGLLDLEDGELSLEELGLTTVILVDEESGEEFEFFIAYDFPFEDEVYYVLVSMDEGEPEALFARLQENEDGSEFFITVADDEFERVAAEYERLCDEMDEDDELF